ncbi:MAG: RelA/SpoT domain-containing protein [Dehalococcoidia bacterium]|nr:RelA/SpoT domain-containing protein [Dehalococcoidia bacterium]
MVAKVDIGRLRQSYELVVPLAERFCNKLTEQIQELLVPAEVSLAVPIEKRVKSWDSLREKIANKNLKVKNAQDIEDLVGIRLILLFQRDVLKTCEIVAKNFDVLNIEDTRQRLGDSELGYQSVHYQIKLPKSWLVVPSFASFDGLCAEIQMRTVAQHIWAVASHTLQYKHEHGVPRPIRRAIHRVSALLETVDLEFERALQEREAYGHWMFPTPEQFWMLIFWRECWMIDFQDRTKKTLNHMPIYFRN